MSHSAEQRQQTRQHSTATKNRNPYLRTPLHRYVSRPMALQKATQQIGRRHGPSQAFRVVSSLLLLFVASISTISQLKSQSFSKGAKNLCASRLCEVDVPTKYLLVSRFKDFFVLGSDSIIQIMGTSKYISAVLIQTNDSASSHTLFGGGGGAAYIITYRYTPSVISRTLR